MTEIHCYNCGGFISDPGRISHRQEPSIGHREFGATPISSLCTCNPPVVYEPRAGRGASPSAPRLN